MTPAATGNLRFLLRAASQCAHMRMRTHTRRHIFLPLPLTLYSMAEVESHLAMSASVTGCQAVSSTSLCVNKGVRRGEEKWGQRGEEVAEKQMPQHGGARVTHHNLRQDVQRSTNGRSTRTAVVADAARAGSRIWSPSPELLPCRAPSRRQNQLPAHQPLCQSQGTANPTPLPRAGEHSLVGVGVVVVVLDPPGLEGVDQGREEDVAHNVLDQVVLVERAVAAVVANHEALRRGAQWVRRR